MRNMSEEELAFQAWVYCHVAALLRYPEDDDGNALVSAANGLADLFAQGSRENELAERMAQQAGEASLLDLQRDYTALFIGALEMAACPYASYWLDGKHQLGGPTTVAVERAYRKRGMKLDQKRKQPGDHMATMLEFLFVMLRDAAQCAHEGDRTSTDGLVGEARNFFESYVVSWVDDLCALVVANAQTGFYRDLGEILPTILIEDSLLIENRNE